MDIKLKDVQKWYADKINKQVIELDSYDLFCAKVAYDYACEQLTIPDAINSIEHKGEPDENKNEILIKIESYD